METNTASESAFQSFEDHTVDAVGLVRRTFTEVIRALPQPITRASELQHVLKIDKALGWRVFNVIRNTDPFAAARYVPGAGSVKTFLRAAEKQGVPSRLTKPVLDALDNYEELVSVHAGNRKRLDMLLSACTDDGRAEVDVANRRLAYEANSYIWGASASAQFRTSFVNLSQTPGELDVATLGGLVGLQRLRRNVRWRLGEAKCTDEVGDTQPTFTIEPMYDVENPDEAAAKLFMSQPRPHIECVRKGQTLRWQLLPGKMGKTGAVTCVTGEIMRRCGPSHQCENDRNCNYVVRVSTPSELLIMDFFLHAEVFGRVEPTVAVYGNFLDGVRDESDSLPLLDSVQYMGRASDVLHTPELPRYAEMTDYVFDRLGWDSSGFDVYRLRIEYPVMMGEVRVSNPLPE